VSWAGWEPLKLAGCLKLRKLVIRAARCRRLKEEMKKSWLKEGRWMEVDYSLEGSRITGCPLAPGNGSNRTGEKNISDVMSRKGVPGSKRSGGPGTPFLDARPRAESRERAGSQALRRLRAVETKGPASTRASPPVRPPEAAHRTVG